MSRIGRMPIIIPDNVKININSGKINITGPKATSSFKLRSEVIIEIVDNNLKVRIKNKNKISSSVFGTTRTLIQNAICGVTEGFEKKLEIHGVGYKSSKKGENLLLELGFSHPVEVKVPDGIEFQVQKNEITISGASKQQVGEIAARIRNIRKVEPYKGKGIRYSDEVVKKKIGKKAKAALGEGGAEAKSSE